jgi:2-polyprenyl-3-methyl-5-hydroxy-6-metoxy-1,4-benzoquinol methylase
MPLTATEATIGAHIPLIGDDPRTIVIKSLIRDRFAGTARAIRVLDLGSLEGGVAFEMAREGWDAVGIEGRASNIEKAELIRRYFGLDNLRFELRDVKSLDVAADGRFEAVLCCGLLYHLDDPFSFLEKLRELVTPDGLLFLDTHVAPDERAARFGTHAGVLAEETTLQHGGHSYEGRWMTEPETGTLLDRQWSAVSNRRSFWPTRRALIRAVYHGGFHSIAELYGMFEIDTEFALRDQFSRLYLACTNDWQRGTT